MKIDLIHLNYKNYLINTEYFIHKWDEKILLFLHGLWANKEDFLWSINNEDISKHTIIWFDFPWHGNSSYIKNLKIDDLVEITDIIISQLDLTNIIIVGHSMWWLIWLLYLYQKFNNRIKWFINIEWNLNKNDTWFTWYISSLSYKDFQKEFPWCDAMYDLAPNMVKYSTYWNLLNKFIELDVPKLFIYWENSNINYINSLQENWINIAKIENSGHHPFNENPDKFYKEISNFLLWI